MELLRDEGEFVTHEALRFLEKPQPQAAFAELHTALQRRVIQIGLLKSGIAPQFEHVEALRTKEGDWVSVGPRLFCRRSRDGVIEVRQDVGGAFNSDEKRIHTNGRAGQTTFAGTQFRWRMVRSGIRPLFSPMTEFFDAEAVGSGIVLRHWRPGDRFQPIGMSSAVKLQDLFVNQKIARTQRSRLVVATTLDGRIFWVEGLRIGEHFKISQRTPKMLQWRWKAKQGRSDSQ
jgi:tRNA(Ile)-lysidine synthase